jgi:hypothetical protein
MVFGLHIAAALLPISMATLILSSYWLYSERCLCLRRGVPVLRKQVGHIAGMTGPPHNPGRVRLTRAEADGVRITIDRGQHGEWRDMWYIGVSLGPDAWVRQIYLSDEWSTKEHRSKRLSRKWYLIAAIVVIVLFVAVVVLSTLTVRPA